ncbi:zf-HC2 domain-containing protein [Azospirillum sp. TSO22-1]|uniref:anti-sigma factor family protein n=1 Tax=Azospirillum sp. TSO22-1 TaxID=716789 RepID=UPI0018EE61A6|nr:zf-HC2 domain-containing protein [Azospirillum sp. TSO22-1]
MNCQETRHLIDASIDGELDLTTQMALDAHLAGCAACRAMHAGRASLVRRLRAGAERFDMPDALRSRLLATRPGAPAEPAAPAPPWRRPWRWPWSDATVADQGPRRTSGPAWALGGLSLASAAAAMVLTLLVVSPDHRNQLAEELVAAHVRSLMAEHLTDIPSSDRHTVKPWFNGRVDVSPPVPDLAEQGFPLAGGRLDYVGGRPVAALVYRRNRHVINLFAWSEPATTPGAVRLTERHGYALLHWGQPGLAVWAVSDLNRSELEDFQRLWTQAGGTAWPR